ncbi:MAG TPA: hypothetical protein VFT59_03460 [Candidatus Saccharimonadales bacterium]|nr:hypothetical protein [Candidatus Saccharimonadales bacterium]
MSGTIPDIPAPTSLTIIYFTKRTYITIDKNMHSPDYPTLYNKRSGIDIQEDLEAILDEPEIHLSDTERERLEQFAQGLMIGATEGVECDASGSLEDVFSRSITGSQETFYPGYFYSAEGAKDAHALGESDSRKSLVNIELMNHTLGEKQRKEIAARSRDWYKQQIAEALLEAPSHDRDFPEEVELTVSYNPDKLLNKFDDLQRYREFYRDVKHKLKENERYSGRMGEAKDSIVDRYLRRVNGLVADLYPSIFALAEQLQLGEETDQVAEWKERLAECAPVVAHLYDSREDSLNDTKDHETFDRFARRLDHFRNGAELQSSGFTAVSQEIAGYAEKASQSSERSLQLQPILPDSLIDTLDKTECNAKQLARLTSDVLREWGLLSQETATWEEVDNRTGTAADDLYQVIITPKQKSLAVDTMKKIVLVPASFKRTFTQASPAGALLVCAHELAHVQQGVFDEALAKRMPLAKIKGRQAAILREAGGKYQERQILERYLGRSYSPNAHYLRAFQEKLAGGNIVQVARAFYESYSAQNNIARDSKKDQAARELAADRVLRLYRFGGHNSQPLNYIEQELIVERLSSMSEEERGAFLLAAGSFNIHDAAMLRKIGMLELPKRAVVDPAEDVMNVFLRSLGESHNSVDYEASTPVS